MAADRQEGELFNPVIVWKNQARDVHPPLYYLLVHLICSLSGGRVSRWQAGVVNILCLLLTLYFLRRTADHLGYPPLQSDLLSLFFILSPGILSLSALFRMYCMAMCVTSATVCVFVRRACGKTQEKMFLRELILCSVAGALTHYYFLIFLTWICLLYLVPFLLRGDWRFIRRFVITMGKAAVIAIALFPFMIYHIFGGYRGKQSFANALHAGMKGLQGYYLILAQDLGGGPVIFTVLVITGLLLFAMKALKRKRAISVMSYQFQGLTWTWTLFAGTVILYYFTIGRVAVSVSSRYLCLCYPTVILLEFEILKTFCDRILPMSEAWKTLALTTLLLIILFFGSHDYLYEWLYRGNEAQLDAALGQETYTDCVYITDCINSGDGWEINGNALSLDRLASVTFFEDPDAIGKMPELAEKDRLLLYVSLQDGKADEETKEQVIRTVIKHCPKLSQSEFVMNEGYASAYILY